jgi:hypothetical protein
MPGLVSAALLVLRHGEVAGSPLQEQQRALAKEIVESYAWNSITGVSTFTIPPAVSDVQAMRAINLYLSENLPHLQRDAIWALDLPWYARLDVNCPGREKRDLSKPRTAAVTGVVRGTIGLFRGDQAGALQSQSLAFSDPRDQAIAAGLHACVYDGADLFEGCYARGSADGVALVTYAGRGVSVYKGYLGTGGGKSAASGSPLSGAGQLS